MKSSENTIELILENNWFKEASPEEMAFALLRLKEEVIQEQAIALSEFAVSSSRKQIAKLNKEKQGIYEANRGEEK